MQSKLSTHPLILQILLVFTGCCAIIGCGSHASRPKGTFSHLPSQNSEVSMEVAMSVDQQATTEILATNPVFTVSLDEDPVAWVRAKLFFEKFLPVAPGKSPVVMRIVGKKWVLASTAEQGDSYLYEVIREESPGAYRYRVNCIPKTPGVPQQLVELNAKNVARFIQEGKFEASLLAR